MTSAVASIATRASFVHPRYRGFRVPNRWSAQDPAELKTLGVQQEIVVHDARRLCPQPTLDSHGFQLVEAPTAVDLLDTDAVRELFYPECRALLRRTTGCGEARGGNHEYRNGFGGETGARGVRPTPNGSGGAYAQGIHADMCAAVEGAFDRILPADRHFESINIWRSATPETIRMMPLAVCAMSSVDPADMAFGDGVNTGDVRAYRKVVDQKLVFAPTQRWYYFPAMRPDEVLLFRQYDTRQEALNLRTVFHTAVADPKTPPDAPMRYTIEVRMQAVYGKEEDRQARRARFMAQISDRYRDGRRCDWWRGPIEGYQPPR